MDIIRKSHQIISYQEINGNYNKKSGFPAVFYIISYQEINGNYNIAAIEYDSMHIISYQEINGNYNLKFIKEHRIKLYHTKK